MDTWKKMWSNEEAEVSGIVQKCWLDTIDDDIADVYCCDVYWISSPEKLWSQLNLTEQPTVSWSPLAVYYC